MALHSSTVARASRALRDYARTERVQDLDVAGDALTDLVVIAQIEGDGEAERQLEEALELLSIGPACAGEAYEILAALSR